MSTQGVGRQGEARQGARTEVFGRFPDGREVLGHTLRSDVLALEVLEYGATVRTLEVAALTSDGTSRNVVLGHETLDDYRRSPAFFGAVVGRFANRLRGGRFEVAGTQHQVTPNEAGNALHGGPDGFDRRVWSTVSVSPSAVTLALVSPHGDQGFPGAVEAVVTYAVQGASVQIDYQATTDRPTVLSLTNHAYFNLAGEGSGSVDDHLLTVAADRFTPTDEERLPTGEVATVDGTPLDLRGGRRIGEVVRAADPHIERARGLDHSFVLEGEGLRPAATLSGSGLRLDLDTDRPALQVYTGNFLDGALAGRRGRLYRQGDGVALEAQAFPDAPNHPHFPSAVLLAGDTYRSTTRWRFSGLG